MREMHSELACGNIRSIPVPFFAGKLKFIPRVLLREKCGDASFKNSHKRVVAIGLGLTKGDGEGIDKNIYFLCYRLRDLDQGWYMERDWHNRKQECIPVECIPPAC